MDDFARRVERSFGLALFYFKQVLEHLAQHFWVNGDFLFQRLGLVDGEIVAVKNIQDASAFVARAGGLGIGKKRVGNEDVGLLPVISGDGFKESAV